MPRRRLLSTRAVATLVRTAIRPFRAAILAGARPDVDARLVAFLATREPAVFLCWHQDFVATLGYLSKFAASRRMVALASPSRDGSLAAAAASGLGFQDVARGSSRDSGAAGLLRLTRLATGERRTSVAIVADGPRPPARVLKPGGLLVARDAALPIWLVRTSWSPERVLSKSWARFHVPRPWGDAIVRADGPIMVPRSLDRVELESMRNDVERRLNALADRADADAARARAR